MPPSEKILLTEPEAAFVLDVEPGSLAVFRCTGRHEIPFLKIGRNVRYRRSDLEAWLTSRTHTTGVTGEKASFESSHPVWANPDPRKKRP
ncbi:DNA binding domain-containing protein, excisionase family [Nitrosospira briensis]|nr:DNA binding domain-containing protein, excisionase family [Nitrosospira briensis]